MSKHIDLRVLNLYTIRSIKNSLSSFFENNDRKQTISNMIHTIDKFFTGDGRGLASGILIEELLHDYFQYFEDYQKYNHSEADCKILNTPLSIKKIKQKSTIALNWSKNKTINNDYDFNVNMMILVLNTTVWWKRAPKSKGGISELNYTQEIESGFYIINKYYCKDNVTLKSNNKTNKLITSKDLYSLLLHSKRSNLFINLPPPSTVLKYSIIKGLN